MRSGCVRFPAGSTGRLQAADCLKQKRVARAIAPRRALGGPGKKRCPSLADSALDAWPACCLNNKIGLEQVIHASRTGSDKVLLYTDDRLKNARLCSGSAGLFGQPGLEEFKSLFLGRSLFHANCRVQPELALSERGHVPTGPYGHVPDDRTDRVCRGGEFRHVDRNGQTFSDSRVTGRRRPA